MWKPSLAIAIYGDHCAALVKQRKVPPFMGACADLPEYIRTHRLQGSVCSVGLPLCSSIVKTIILESKHRHALHSMARQAIFWQEYCGIDASQFHCRWRILSPFGQGMLAVLLVAIPAKEVQQQQDFLKQAVLKPIRFGLHCIDLFKLTQVHPRHCTVVLDAHTSYVIAGSRLQLELQVLPALSMPSLEQAVQTEHASPALPESFLDALADAIQTTFSEGAGLASGHLSEHLSDHASEQAGLSDPVSVAVVNVLNEDLQTTFTQSLSRFLPNEFEIQLYSPHALLKRCNTEQAQDLCKDTTHPVSTLGLVLALQQRHSRIVFQRKGLMCSNLLPRRPFYQNRAVLYIQWCVLFVSIVTIIFSGIQHQQFSSKQQLLAPQLKAYHEFVARLQHKQKQLAQLQQQSSAYHDIFTQAQQARASGQSAVRFLELLSAATPASIFIVQVELTAPAHMRINAYARSEMFVSQYATALRSHAACSNLQIKNISATQFDTVKYFSMNCGYDAVNETEG